MDVRRKGLAVAVVVGIVLAFAYFSRPLGALAAIAAFPFVLSVVTR